MALNKDPGSIALQGLGKRGEVVSNEAEVAAIRQVANAGFGIFESVAKSSLREDVESIFEDVPEFEGLAEDEFATASITGGPSVTVSTAGSPLLARMVADVRNKQRAVEQGVRSQQWYQAQVNKIVAEYTDMAPGLAREFASVGANSFDRGINKVAARLEQDKIFEEQREQLITQGEKYNIPRTEWDRDPLGAAAMLEARAQLEGQAKIASSMLDIEKSRGELNKINAAALFNRTLPHISKSVAELLEQRMGLLAGASPEAMAQRLQNLGPAAAVQLEQDWRMMKLELYSKFNAGGQGIDQTTFDANVAPLDEMVRTAVDVINGKKTEEAMTRVVALHTALTDNQLLDTPEDRRVMSLVRLASNLPDGVVANSVVSHMSDMLGNFVAGQVADFTNPATGTAGAGLVTTLANSPDSMPEDKQVMGDFTAQMFDQLAQDPTKVHVRTWDEISKATKDEAFWDAVDALEPSTRQRIYDGFNTTMLERAVKNDAVAASEFANRSAFGPGQGVISRGEMPSIRTVKDLITVSTGYPPVAKVRPGLPDGATRAARDAASKFNQNVGKRVKESVEAYTEFLKRTGDGKATPEQAYRLMYGGRIGTSYLKEGETPSVAPDGRKWIEEHQDRLRELGNDRAKILEYVRDNGAPDSILDLVGG